MNELIKQLAEQANEAFYQQMGVGAERGTFYFNGFAKQFAELIIVECIKRVESKAGRVKGWTDEIINRCIIECAEDLKQHFGIKE